MKKSPFRSFSMMTGLPIIAVSIVCQLVSGSERDALVGLFHKPSFFINNSQYASDSLEYDYVMSRRRMAT